ncbi:hypothetical protein HN587_07400 [Candidatus Woesearchaeota archaeon]|jgi:hypothetical protein|nr:hypothetical protein [Candidatus Woesearchaeota archaeon]
MKKIIFLLLTLTILLATIVSSYELVQVKPNKFATESFPYNKISVEYQKGWNLIPASTLHYSFYDGEDYNNYDSVQQWRKSWKYIYLPITKSYIGVKDNSEFVGVNSMEEAGQLLKSNYENRMTLSLAAQWIFFTENTKLNYYTSPNADLKSGGEYAQYEKGWNFLVIPIELSEGDIGLEDCEFSKIYQWVSSTQSWQTSSTNQMLSKIGKGFAVYVKNDCALGSGLNPGTPPSFPN